MLQRVSSKKFRLCLFLIFGNADVGKQLPASLHDNNALPDIVDPYGGGRKKGGCC